MKSTSRSLYVWVLVGIFAGAVLGACLPDAGVACKPLGDAFIRLVRMIVTPVVFFSVVLGVTQMRDLKGVGRVGLVWLAGTSGARHPGGQRPDPHRL